MKNILILLMLSFSLSAFASKSSSVKTGDWNSSSTCDNGIPGCYDTIVINQNHTIKITQNIDLSNCTPIYVIVDGTLKLTRSWFGTYYTLKLPDSSAISVSSTGTVTGKDGFFNSNKIYAGDDVIYDAYDGDVDGPDYLAQDNVNLPVELLEYSYNYDTQKLNWSTATETNNNYYTITIFEKDGTIVDTKIIYGAGTINNISKYSTYIKYDDCYVSVKQTDYDGKEEELFTIYIKKSDRKSKLTLYPNPAQDYIKLNNIEIGEEIIIFNLQGQELIKTTEEKIDISFLENGIYFIKYKKNILKFLKL
jgi:hypothetical protein